MNKVLTIGLAAVAIAAVLPIAPAAAIDVVYAPLYGGPRIIHVPQPGEHLGLPDSNVVYSDGDDDDVGALPPAPQVRKAIRDVTPRRAKAVPPRTSFKPAPHRDLRSDAPPPPPLGPPRPILSAPPPSLSDGPTPIRPTPRFGAQSAASPAPAPAAETATAQ